MNHIIKEEVNPCLNFHNSQVVISGTYKCICSATRSQIFRFKFRNSQVYAQLPELTGINFQNLQNMLRYQITEVYVQVPELTGICSTEPVNQWGNIVNLTLKNKFQESEIYIEIHIFSFKKMLKMSPGKWCPLCICLNVLMEMAFIIKDSVYCTKQDARCLYMQTGSTWRLDCSTLILYYCPASRTTLVATRFWVVMICPIIKCLTVLEFSFILFDLCLFITIFNFILNYVPIVTFWIFTYHKIWILLIIFCFIWSYWIIYFSTSLEVFWSVVS